MEFLLERAVALLLALAGPVLTIFDLPGNTVLLLAGLGFAFVDSTAYFDGRLLSAMVLIYALGEGWEFCVELFGIKRQKVSWLAVFLIAVGGFAGTLVGTAVLPLFGSILGGIVGAAATAFVYELLRTGARDGAVRLAWEAAKVRFWAVIGKMAAGIALAALLIRQVFFNQ